MEAFDDQYPNISWWCQGRGWIEVGPDEYRSSLIRVLDIGGMLWEGDDEYDNVGAALEEAMSLYANQGLKARRSIAAASRPKA